MINEMTEGYPKQGKTLEERSRGGLLDDLWHERQEFITILCEAVRERDDEPEAYPVTPSCNECTEGSTPMSFDKGLCWYHRALRAIARAEGK